MSSASSLRFLSSKPGTGPVSARTLKNPADGFLKTYYYPSDLPKSLPIYEETRISILESLGRGLVLYCLPFRQSVMLLPNQILPILLLRL
jgi:hypothetical protein